MTREELWKEFENQLIGETRISMTMTFDEAERMTKLGIKEIVAKWKGRLEQDTCEDCVSRQAVVQWLENATDDSIEHAIDSNLEFIPPVTPTRKKGKWIKGITHEKYDYFGDRVRVADYKCSVCGRVIVDIGVDDAPFTNRLADFPYCHCGAEMESEDDSN